MQEQQRIKSYRIFFDYYLNEHQNSFCRALHYMGTAIELASLAALVATWRPLFVLTAAIGGYGLAWLGHFVFEQNRPAAFAYPVWSYVADHHMFVLAMTGRLKARRAETSSL